MQDEESRRGQTNIEYWAMTRGANTMLRAPDFEVGEPTEDGESYNVTFVYPAQD
ncbi:hypothetical protein [Streptomyces sp. NPDC002599]|uniref:hypothetical protein n=1 Tax=Streptomyces sp. NPDC002599 TaxID=3154421 RepID=UPI00332DDD46